MKKNSNGTILFLRKNLILVIIILSFFFGKINAQTPTAPSGLGSACNPYLISSIDNLYWITQNSSSWASGKYFVQTANIDATVTSSWNSGAGFPKIGTFSANYDGRGYSISNITMNTTGGNSGIFGYLNGATVQNLNIINPTITFSSGNSNGVLAGVAASSSTITNVNVNGGSFTNNGTGFAHSGFIGDIWGSTITSCSTSTSVTSNGLMTGGFVGRILGASTFNKCSASSTLNIGSVSRIGGFVGQTEHSSGIVTFNECFSSGSINGSSYAPGGFIGLCFGNINFNNCYASVAMPNINQASGFWGSLWSANSASNSVNFNNCYSVGLVTNSSGGGFGSTTSTTFVYSNCFWDNQSSTKSNGLTSSTPTGLTGKTTLEMKTQSTFSSSGWDFSTKWSIDSVVNNGYPSLIFPAVTISTAVAGCPIINVSGTTSSFTTCNGTPSSTQSVTVSGSSLSANINVTAPTGFEISTSSSSGFGTSLTLIQSGGSVASTIVYIRLIGSISGNQSGNVSFASTSATTLNVTVSGTVTANTWTGATNNLWNEVSNWSCGLVPNGSNDIVISSGTPTLNTDLTIQAGKSLTISGTGTLTIAPGKTLTIAGTADFGGKDVTYKSDATGSGMFGPLTGTLTGATNVKVERYIPAKRAYRFVSSPVTTTTTIKQNWQENAGTTAGLGTHITGTGGATNGFDATGTNNPSMFTFDNGSWVAVANTNVNVLNAGTPYRLMVRGDRTTDLTTNTPTATATTLRATGTLKTGNFVPTINQTADGFSLVGNPYQAPIDIKAILTASSNMSSGVVYYWDPTLNARGGYVTRNLTTDANDVTSSFNQYVQPGQAVFVKRDNTANAASVTITESHKSVANGAAGVFRMTTSNDYGLLRVNLQANTNNQWQNIEGTLALFNDNFNWNVTSEDATKMSNLDEEVSFVQNNTSLAIACVSAPGANSELPIQLNNLRQSNYQWQFELNNYSGVTPYLFDTQNNTYTEITNGATVPFTATTTAANRFKIVFQPSALSTDDFANGLVVYPNPAKAGASFYVQGITAAEVTVYNVLGQNIPVEVKSQGNALQVMPTQTLSQGIYLIIVTTEGKTQQVKWIVE